MAMTLTPTAADAMLGGLAALCNNARIRIYSGNPPANAAAALNSNGLLAEAVFGSPAFSTIFTTSGNNRVAAANTIATDSADASGDATFFRIILSDNSTALLQGSVGTSAADMIMPNISIIVGGTVSISALAISLPMA